MKTYSTEELLRKIARVHDESLTGFADRPAARDLLATVTAVEGGRDAPRSRRRPAVRAAGAAGLAAAVAAGAAVAIVAQRTDGSGPATPRQVRNVSAVEILHRAAAAARSEQELHPRDDQYIYVKSTTAWGPGVSHPGQPKGEETREVWNSVDASKPDLLRTACWKNPARTCDSPLDNDDVPKNQPKPVPGTYLWTLQNASKLLRSWRADLAHPNPHPTESPGKGAWEEANDLLGEKYLPPRLRAEVFDFLADIPGTTVTDNATDALGRSGVAVSKTMYQTRTDLVFDRKTYRFLGKREIFLGPQAPITDWRRQPEGSNFDMAWTVLKIKTVNHLPKTTLPKP
jgi:hypothetical protein